MSFPATYHACMSWLHSVSKTSFVLPVHKKWSFPLRIYLVNVTKSARIWPHFLNKSLMKNIFCAANCLNRDSKKKQGKPCRYDHLFAKYIPVSIYFFKVKHGYNISISKICWKLTIKIAKRYNWLHSGVLNVNPEPISYIFLLPSLILNSTCVLGWYYNFFLYWEI